jgi:hypothetical protein
MSYPMVSLVFSSCYGNVLKITTLAGFLTSFVNPNPEYNDMQQLQRTIKNTSIGAVIGLTSPISIPVILMTKF